MASTDDNKQVQGEEKYGERTYMARVKWFNRTAGWGFVSLTKSAEEHDGDDIFVHWRSLDVDQEQYKYLVNGEYVSLRINYSPEGEHSYQASNVAGVDVGPLMCETRNSENDGRRSGDGEGTEETRDGGRRPRGRGGGGDRNWKGGGARESYPVRGPREGDEWYLVKGRNNRGGGGGGGQGRPQRQRVQNEDTH